MDHHEVLVEAVGHVSVWQMRPIVELTVTEAAHALRRAIQPTSMGWGDGRTVGQTRPRGFEIRPDYDSPSVLITWRELAAAVFIGWRPAFTDLHDHAHTARLRLDDAVEHPVDWPRGVDDYYRISAGIAAADRWIHDEVMLNVAACDPAFNPAQLVLL